MSVSRLTITDGSVAYRDARDGRDERVTGLDVETALADLAAPVEAEGRFTFKGVSAGFSLALATPAGLLAERKADAAVTLTLEDASVTARGAIDLSAASLFTGTVSGVAPDLRAVAAALALPPPLAGTLKVEASVAAGPSRADVTDLTLVADETTVTGEIGVDLAGARPRVDARLVADAVDLDRLAARRPATDGRRGEDPPIDPGVLSVVDGGLDVTVGRITGRAFERAGAIEGVHLIAVAEAGTADVKVDGVRLAGGSLSLRTKLKPEERRIRLDGSVKADGFEIAALAALARASLPVDAGSARASASPPPAGRSLALSESLDAAGSISLDGGALTRLGLAGVFGDPAADRLDRIRLKADFASLADPLRIDGTGRFRGRGLEFTATVDPRRVLDGHAFPLAATVATGGVKASFDGDVMTAQSAVTGRARVDADSLAALAAIAGRPAAGLPAGAFRLAADVDTGPGSVSVDNMKVSLGDGGFSGAVTVNVVDRPRVSARFDGPVVDIGGLLAGAAGASGPAADPTAPSAGWSTAPLDLSGFRAFDADIRIGAGGLRYGALTTGRAEASITVQRGKLAIDVPKAELFGGSATAALTLDAAADVPAATVEDRPRRRRYRAGAGGDGRHRPDLGPRRGQGRPRHGRRVDARSRRRPYWRGIGRRPRRRLAGDRRRGSPAIRGERGPHRLRQRPQGEDALRGTLGPRPGGERDRVHRRYPSDRPGSDRVGRRPGRSSRRDPRSSRDAEAGGAERRGAGPRLRGARDHRGAPRVPPHLSGRPGHPPEPGGRLREAARPERPVRAAGGGPAEAVDRGPCWTGSLRASVPWTGR